MHAASWARSGFITVLCCGNEVLVPFCNNICLWKISGCWKQHTCMVDQLSNPTAGIDSCQNIKIGNASLRGKPCRTIAKPRIRVAL